MICVWCNKDVGDFDEAVKHRYPESEVDKKDKNPLLLSDFEDFIKSFDR